MSARDTFHVYLRNLNAGDIGFRVVDDGRHVLGITPDVQLYVRPDSDDLPAAIAGLRKLADTASAMAGALSTKLDADPAKLCPGCVGRGTGARCCVCDRPIPPGMRRQPDDPPEYRPDCADCAAGRAHVHGGAK